MSIQSRIKIEQYLLRLILEALEKNACKNTKGKFVVECTEENEAFDDVQKAFDYVNDLDEARLVFKVAGKPHMIYLVFGNDGYDLISDCSASLANYPWFADIEEKARKIERGEYSIILD